MEPPSSPRGPVSLLFRNPCPPLSLGRPTWPRRVCLRRRRGGVTKGPSHRATRGPGREWGAPGPCRAQRLPARCPHRACKVAGLTRASWCRSEVRKCNGFVLEDQPSRQPPSLAESAATVGAVQVSQSPPAGGVKVSPLGRLDLRGRPKAPCQPTKASPTPRTRAGFFLISFASLGLSMLTIHALSTTEGKASRGLSARSSRPVEQL